MGGSGLVFGFGEKCELLRKPSLYGILVTSGADAFSFPFAVSFPFCSCSILGVRGCSGCFSFCFEDLAVRMWEILVNEQGWISYVSYVFTVLRLCSMREDLLLSFPNAISFVYTTCLPIRSRLV